MARALVDTLCMSNLNQFNHIKNNLDRTLDLVISNIDHSKISLVEDIDTLISIDKHHPALLITINLKPLKYLNEKRLPKFNFFRANYINYVNVPKVKCVTNKFPCWYSTELQKLIRLKSDIKEIHDAKKKKGIDVTADYELFAVLRKRVKQLQDQCHDNYVTNIEEKLSSNTKCFFSYTKAQRASNSLPKVVHNGNANAADRQSVCNLFADYFDSVYQRLDHEVISKNQITPDFIMSPILIRRGEINLDQIGSLQSFKS